MIVGLLCCGLTQQSLAQSPAQGGPNPGPSKLESFTFEMRGKPWATVLEWLVDKTGMPFVSANLPTGSFNFIAKKGQKFTIPQIVDIINDGLLSQNYVLIQRSTSFTVIPADQEISHSLVPHVAPRQLGDHGKTEIVATIVKLKSLAAKDMANEVRKQMGPFGKVAALTTMNQLLLQDTVGNLERIIAMIHDGDQARSKPLHLEVIALTALDSRRVAETLKAVFPDTKNLAPYIESDPVRNAIIVKGTAEEVADVRAAIRSIGEDPGSKNLLVINMDRGSGATLADALQRLMSQIRPESPVRVIGISKD